MNKDLEDGFGKTKSPDNSGAIRIWINVRRDREIPDFDAVSALRYEQDGLEKQQKYTDTVIAMATEHMGMFVNDGLKLEEKDIYSMAGDDVRAMDGVYPPIVALRAFKKALQDYLLRTEQYERLKRVTEKLVCTCRNVTDYEIKDAVGRGKTTFELVRDFTGAGAGCGSCENRVREIVG